MAGTSKKRYFQEPLFQELKKDYCYVCYERIKNNEGVYIGNNMWRHGKCKPGSSRWLRSKVGKESHFYGRPVDSDHEPGL